MSETASTAKDALSRAREHAGATLSSLGEAVEDLTHTAAERLPELAGKAGELAGRAEAIAGVAGTVGATAAEAAKARLDEGVHAARKELAARLDPAPPPASRWWWIGAGVLVTAASVIAWIVLSRRPQQVEPATEPPATEPPRAVDVEPDEPAPARRNGRG